MSTCHDHAAGAQPNTEAEDEAEVEAEVGVVFEGGRAVPVIIPNKTSMRSIQTRALSPHKMIGAHARRATRTIINRTVRTLSMVLNPCPRIGASPPMCLRHKEEAA